MAQNRRSPDPRRLVRCFDADRLSKGTSHGGDRCHRDAEHLVCESVRGGLMRVAEIMTRDVEIVNPDDTLQTAAKMMGEINAGALPVGANNRLVGMITDRDIAVRAVGEGLDPPA